MDSKPVVFYTPHPHQHIAVGERAYIFGLKGHPKQETGELVGESVLTSHVQRISAFSSAVTLGVAFETENTLYFPSFEDMVPTDHERPSS